MVYVLFILGFIIIIFGADLLVNGASSLGNKLKIPDLVIGLTIVAVGTSLPEVVINVFASVRKETGLAISNILGSNLLNLLFIVGVASLIRPMEIIKETTYRDIPISLFSVLLLGLLVNDLTLGYGSSNAMKLPEGVLFLVLLLVYIYITLKTTRPNVIETEAPSADKPALKSILLIIVGAFLLFLGGRWIINGTVEVSALLGITNSEVGLVIIATATSLPELSTSIVAAVRKKAAIAVGNAVGSSIFNVFLVLGISSIITALPFDMKNNTDLFALVMANIMLFVFVFTGKGRQIERWEGILMILAYLGYMTYRLSI
jgi:cation:H+ antiporter